MSTLSPAPSAVAGEGSEAAGSPSATENGGGVDTGLIGLVMLARFHEIAADPDQLAHEFKEPGKPFGTAQILLAAKHLGLKAKSVRSRPGSGSNAPPLPALAVGQRRSVFYPRPDRRRTRR